MQRQHRSDQRTNINHHARIVTLHPERLSNFLVPSQLGQQTHHLLQVIHHLMVQRHLARADTLEVFADLGQSGMQPAQRGELGGDARREGLGGEEGRGGQGRGRSDVSEEMLDADLFCFFGFDRGGDVGEGALGGGAVLLLSATHSHSSPPGEPVV